MTDIVKRLRAPANWLRQDKGSEWKNAINHYDRTPFEAADEIERLRAALWEIIQDSFSLYAIAVARAALQQEPKP